MNSNLIACIAQAEKHSIIYATEHKARKELFREKLLELVNLEIANRLTKLRGFSGVLDNGEIVCSLSWNLAVKSCLQETDVFFKEL